MLKSSSLGTEIKSIKTLLSDFFFIIPMYQRKYEWDNELIIGLIKDILDYSRRDDSKYNYNLGSLFYFKKKNDNFYENDIVVVDGQQRLTTIFLILRELSNLSEKNGLNIHNTINDFLFGRREKNDSNIVEETLRIKREYEYDNEYFENAINSTKFDKENIFQEKGKIISNYFKNKHLIPDEIVKFYKTLIYETDIQFVEIKTEGNYKEFHTFFENLNLKFKVLNIFNLVKNYIYANKTFYTLEENDNERRKQIIADFEWIDENLSNFNLEEKDLNNYMSFFLIYFSKNKKQTLNKMILYERVKEFFSENNKEEMMKKIDDFLNFFKFVASMLNKKAELINEKTKEYYNNGYLKFLWLLDSHLNTFLLILYKIYKIEGKESATPYEFFDNKWWINHFGKYMDDIFHYTVRKIILQKGEISENAFFRSLAISKDIYDYESFRNKMRFNEEESEIEYMWSVFRNKSFYNGEIKIKNFKSLSKFLASTLSDKKKNDINKIFYAKFKIEKINDLFNEEINYEDFLAFLQ